ncbi:MAG: hypothetical protein HeimC2_34560 [Candidatus Heimdallarchaeota archaeon LC_2]|nr:MAG: hypothetical protein HeimC2_34560 [Candidatus Heimdallarchaeota archaeon LC_2]
MYSLIWIMSVDTTYKNHIVIKAKGHENILSKHNTTWQITKEDYLSTKGDCIIGVSSNMGCVNLPKWMKNHLQNSGKIKIVLKAENIEFVGTAEGHPGLSLEDERDMVFRKSSFISPRTAAINSSFVAGDLPSEMIEQLQNPKTNLIIILEKI